MQIVSGRLDNLGRKKMKDLETISVSVMPCAMTFCCDMMRQYYEAGSLTF